MKTLSSLLLSSLIFSGLPATAGTINLAPGATMKVNGTVNATSVQGATGSTLSGSGSVVATTTVNGNLTPGPGTAILASGDLTLDPYGLIEIGLANTLSIAGTDYDQIAVNGSVSLNGGGLVFVDNGYSASLGQQLTILTNDGADPITGTFIGLPEGATVNLPGTTAAASISYTGGDGNDIALTLFADSTGGGTIVAISDLAALATNGIINLSELSSGVVLGGTVGTGSDGLTITLNIGGLQTTTVSSGGTWSIALDDGTSGIPGALDISGLVDGPVTVTADMVDHLGNMAVQATDIFELNIIDTLVIDSPIAGDDRVNASELATGFQLTGTSEVESGQILTVSFEDTLGTIVEAPSILREDGTWSLEVGSIDLVTEKTLLDAANKERDPEITILKNRSWILAYSVPGDGSDGTDFEVYFQRYSEAGNTIGSPVKVDASDTNTDNNVEVAALEDGGWIIVWTSVGDLGDGTDLEVAIQRYDNNGNPVGSNVRVNESNTTDDKTPSVAALGDGGWIVVWAGVGIGGDGNDQEIIGQRYAADGSPVAIDGTPGGGNVKLDDADGNRTDATPTIKIFPNGNWLLGWQGWGTGPGNWDAFYKRFASDGSPLSADMTLNDAPDDATSETGVRIAPLADNEWVVTWRDSGTGNTLFEHFTTSGTSAASGTVNTSGTPSHLTTLSGLNDGGWIAAWGAADTEPDLEIFSQRFDTNGSPIGGNNLVSNQDTSFDGRPMSSPLPGGGWLLVWETAGRIVGQCFASSGDPLVEALSLTSLTDGTVTINTTISNLAGTPYLASTSILLDTTAPIITLPGDSSVTLDWGETWTDPGATSIDNIDGALTTIIGGDIVDTATPGVYLVSYDAIDDAGNSAIQLSRTVSVRETYQWWSAQNGLTENVNDGFSNDPDLDGSLNGMEFAFDGNPLASTSNEKIRVVPFDTSEASHLSITFPVRAGAVFTGPSADVDGVTYSVQGSIDGHNSDSAVIEVSPALDSGLPALTTGWEYRSFRLVLDITASDLAFLRIGIQQTTE